VLLPLSALYWTVRFPWTLRFPKQSPAIRGDGSQRRGRQLRFGIYLADLSHRRTSSHGIVNYALGLTTALLSGLRDDERLVLFVNDEVVEMLEDHEEAARLQVAAEVHVLQAPRSQVERLWMDHGRSVVHAAVNDLNILHFPKGFIPLLNPTGARLVATVHDDIPCRYSEGTWGRAHASHQNEYFAWAVRHAVRRADYVLTVSEFSRACLEMRQNRRRRGPPISVTHQGVTLPTRAFVPVAKRNPHILHIGSRFPHKRSLWGISTMLRYLDYTGMQLRLRILGDLDDEAERVATHPRVDRVRGSLSNEDIATEMTQARALLFPSEYEGFGLPPVEALCLGTPVIYARTAATAEVLRGIPGGYGSTDERAFREAFDEALRSSDEDLQRFRSRLRESFSWEKVGQRTLEVYRTLARCT
jgi:glycosyltransferase involved in cell wall biosynthesis